MLRRAIGGAYRRWGGQGYARFGTATVEDGISVSEVDGKGFVRVGLCNPPVNAMDVSLMRRLSSLFDSTFREDGVRGVVLGSDLPGVFSGGLDLSKLHPPPARGELEEFLASVWGVFGSIYLFPKPVVCVVHNSAPAGGTLLSLAADLRLGASDAPKAVMGLNEVQIGFPAPPWLCRVYARAIGEGRAERLLKLGTMVGFAEAHSLGLLDELAPTASLPALAVQRLQEFAAVPPAAFAGTKLQLREPVIPDITDPAQFQAGKEQWLDFFASEAVKQRIQAYVTALAKKSKKKRSEDQE